MSSMEDGSESDIHAGGWEERRRTLNHSQFHYPYPQYSSYGGYHHLQTISITHKKDDDKKVRLSFFEVLVAGWSDDIVENIFPRLEILISLFSLSSSLF